MDNSFKNFPALPLDEIFSLKNEFVKDPKKDKINGGMGVYLDEQGEPYVMPVVKKAIKRLSFSNFSYLPIQGDLDYLEKTARLVLGSNLYSSCKNKISLQGTMGGTNGLSLLASLFKRFYKKPSIIMANPSWGNHRKIFSYLGFKIIGYDHLDLRKNFNFKAFKKTFLLNPTSLVLFHGGSTHNPTGVNPSEKQWGQIVKLFKKSKAPACFDFAYMGLGENIKKDCFPIRLFIENKISTSVVISYSKNMSLYQHRVGALLFCSRFLKEKSIIESHLRNIFRMTNSNPAAFGEKIVSLILGDKKLKKEWQKSLLIMVKSLKKRRSLFVKKAGIKFDYINKQKGLFSLLDLNKKQIKKLKDNYGIYLLSNGRINFGGLSLKNASRVAEVILKL